MKEWNKPEINELSVTNTEGTYLNGVFADGGFYKSNVEGGGQIPLTSDGSLLPQY